LDILLKIDGRVEKLAIHWMNRWQGVGGVMGCGAGSHRCQTIAEISVHTKLERIIVHSRGSWWHDINKSSVKLKVIQRGGR
jgi:hypothetical protein